MRLNELIESIRSDAGLTSLNEMKYEVGDVVKLDDSKFKILREYPTKEDADGPLPRDLLRLVPRGGGACIAKMVSGSGSPGHYVIYKDAQGKISGAPVWMKPMQYERAMQYEQ